MTFKEIILGTSPFIFAPQFGHRTRLYELDFENQPENIAKVLDKSYEMGVHKILLNRSKDLESALDISIQNSNQWEVIGKTDVANFDEDLSVFSKYNTKTIILDGFFVDENIENNSCDNISYYLEQIKSSGFVPAIETRTPFKNIPKIVKSEIMADFDEIMLPLNFYGYMMDCNFLNNENKQKIQDLLSKLNKKIIVNRTLATGILQPEEAYKFLVNVDNIDSVCVGVAKVEEAEETFSIINKYKS
ncbi:MAG TPA: hypothetical protein HA277_04620 [Methanosphaera sp.]|nr:hypothetical protein [Methanosphaera sp.]HII08123.1 hypothetical protein [Methanosphaera sp.]HIJ15669.1 hypothetical protein [Methanosphaera sp.]